MRAGAPAAGSLAGKTLFITGASRGIGKAIGLRAARDGANVVVAAKTTEAHPKLPGTIYTAAEEIEAAGGRALAVPLDIRFEDQVVAAVERAVATFGGLDILVNNAGIGATGHFADVSFENLRKIFEVNFFGLTETVRAFLPVLKRGNKPAVVNISSIAGKRGIPARSHYSSSKFAVQGFSEAIRAELAKDGIDVLVVSPGLTQTNFSKNMLEQKAKIQLDHMRGMTSEEVARAAPQQDCWLRAAAGLHAVRVSDFGCGDFIVSSA